MSEHLSAQQIDEWVVGERTREAEEHLRQCKVCADEVERVAVPLKLFGSAVRSWSEQMTQAREWAPVNSLWGTWRWRLALVAAAVLMMIAVPVYRHEVAKQRAAVMAAQDEMLLRQVEKGISRSVPAPMEPLAKLMPSDLSR